MSRRLILLVGLSLAAILLASFVLLQGRSDFARPLFPKPWGSSSDADSNSGSSWLKEHIDGLLNGDSGNADADSTFHDPHDKPPSSALADEPSAKEEQKQDEKPASGQLETLGDADATETEPVTASSTASAGAADSSDGPLSIAIAETGGYHDEVIEISLVEVGGSHDEVLAALIHSFGSQPNVQLQLYQRLQRYGIKDIFDQFQLGNPLPEFIHKSKFTNFTEKQPTIVVSTTCEFDAPEYQRQYNELLELGNTYLYCVIHHADRWGPDQRQAQVLLPWVKKGMAEFVALSKHTQNFLDAELAKWDTGGVKPKTKHFVPVFPVDLSKTPEAKVNSDELAFALQGDYSSGRRNYGKIFEHLGKFLTSDEGNDLDVQLHLIGHGGHPKVPEELVTHVNFDESLEYLQFYGIMSRQFALLPAFASDEYLDRKASSTVPASLIAGTPLVATQALLDAYSYLPADCVWFQEEGEEDFDVIGRVINKSAEERNAKKLKVQEANNKRIEMNRVLTQEWVREAQVAIRKNKEEMTKAAAEADSAPEGVGAAVQGSEKLNSETNEPPKAEGASRRWVA